MAIIGRGESWGVNVDTRLRWKRGLQIGERQRVTRYTIDAAGKRVRVGADNVGEWTWYTVRGKRVEGPVQTGPNLEVTIHNNSTVTQRVLPVGEKIQ